MFDNLFDFLKDWQHWLSWIFRALWKFVVENLKSWWGVVLIVVGWLWTAVEWIGSVLSELVTRVDAIAFPAASYGSGPTAQVLAICNTFLPLTEMFTMMLGTMTLAAALTLYKLIKSWIPGGFG